MFVISDYDTGACTATRAQQHKSLRKSKSKSFACCKYCQVMPGFKAQTSGVINDSDKWREAMMQAREQLDEVRKSARVKQKNVTSVGRV